MKPKSSASKTTTATTTGKSNPHRNKPSTSTTKITKPRVSKTETKQNASLSLSIDASQQLVPTSTTIQSGTYNDQSSLRQNHPAESTFQKKTVDLYKTVQPIIGSEVESVGNVSTNYDILPPKLTKTSLEEVPTLSNQESMPSYEQRVLTTSLYGSSVDSRNLHLYPVTTTVKVSSQGYHDSQSEFDFQSDDCIGARHNQSMATKRSERMSNNGNDDFLLHRKCTWVKDADVFEKCFGVPFLVQGHDTINENNKNKNNFHHHNNNNYRYNSINSTDNRSNITNTSVDQSKKEIKVAKEYNPYKDIDLMSDVELVKEIARRQKERLEKRMLDGSSESET